MDLQDHLHQAILYGDISEIDSLLDQGADINTPVDNQLPLSTAILNGENDVAVHLLQRGADISLPRPLSLRPRTVNNSRLGSWQPSRATVVALQVALGVAVSAAISRSAAQQGSSTSAFGTLHRIFDFWIPWGVASLAFGALMLLQTRAAKSKQAIVGRVFVIVVLLCLYGISWFLPDQTPWGMVEVFSWIWKGVIWRALFAVGVNTMRHNQSQSQQKKEKDFYPGSEVIDSLLASNFKSEKLMSALLDANLFSSGYMRAWQATDQMVLTREDPLATLWTTAASLDFDTIVRRLIDLGIPIDTPLFTSSTFNSTTLLAIAASHGQPQVVKFLLESGADVEGDTPVTRQSISPYTPLVLCLLASDRYDTSSSESRCKVAQLLIQAGADTNSPHHSSESPLAISVKNCPINIVRLLLQHGAIPTTSEIHQGTLIYSATNRRDAANLLALFGPEFGNVDATDDTGFTPLMRAAMEGKTDAARHLLVMGAQPGAQSHDGWTVLQLAAWYGPKALLELLLDTDFDVNARAENTNTALFQACRRHAGRVGVVKLLLERGADPNIRAGSWKKGATALHEVCRSSSNALNNVVDYTDQVDAVKILVQHGADVNATYSVEDVPSETDVTPLGLAAAHARGDLQASIFDLLLNAGADPNGFSDTGLPALLTCCANTCDESTSTNIPDPVVLLLAHGADITIRDKTGMTPLHHVAAQHRSRATICLLQHLDPPAQTTALATRDELGRTPLHLASADPHWMILAAYASWSAHCTPGTLDAANFHNSLASNLVLSTLQQYGSDPFLVDANGATALHVACKVGNPRIVGMLLKWAGSRGLCDVRDWRGRVALHYAVGSVEVTRMLMRFGARGMVGYDEYLDVEEREEVRLMEEVCGSFDADVLQQNDSSSGISSSVGSEGTQHDGLGANVQDQVGNTPLHYAALAGVMEVVELYLDMPGVDVGSRNNDGETALDYAKDERCVAVIRKKWDDIKRQKTAKSAPKSGERVRQRRKEAENFVEQLLDKDVWGVYP